MRKPREVSVPGGWHASEPSQKPLASRFGGPLADMLARDGGVLSFPSPPFKLVS